MDAEILNRQNNYLKTKCAILIDDNERLIRQIKKTHIGRGPVFYLVTSLRRDHWNSIAQLLDLPVPKSDSDKRRLLKLIRKSVNNEA